MSERLHLLRITTRDVSHLSNQRSHPTGTSTSTSHLSDRLSYVLHPQNRCTRYPHCGT
ncbi:uncharacterized protein METZ01_LOCUS270693, partial [marine metagenome]